MKNTLTLSCTKQLRCWMLLISIMVLSLFSTGVNAQVTVTNPGNTTPALSATYTSLALAIADVNNRTAISGPVTIALNAATPQTAPAGGYSLTNVAITGGSNTNRFIFDGGGNTITAGVGVSTTTDAFFKVTGADFITLQNFTMLESVGNTTPTTQIEWGVALLYATTTNGAQNITIQNNTITLNRTNVNTFGIYSNSTHTATAATTSATATTTAGANSNMLVYGNTISNVNMGIVVVGPTAVADVNTGIDIGGTGGVQANSITNFGTSNAISGYANVSGTVNGILVRNSIGFNISFNTISSSVGGQTVGSTLNGIQIPAATNTPTATFTNTINNNNISLQSGLTTAAMVGISYPSGSASATSTLNVNSNNFNTFGHTVALASGTITFITVTSTNQFTTINSNKFTNISVNTTGNVTFISQSFTAPATGTKAVNSNAIITAFAKTGAGGTVTFVTDNGSTVSGAVSNCQNNDFSNVTLTGATAITGISYTDGGTAPTRTVTGNILNNWTTGAGTINAMNFTYLNGVSSISLNKITNITGQGSITGITIGSTVNTATSVTIAFDTITNLTSTGTGGAVTGITCSNTSTAININNNAISTLASTGASAVVGIGVTGATTTNVFKNTICDISGSNASSTVNGILISSGTTVNASNNRVGDLRTPAANASNPLIGINITGGTTVNAYYNTVNLANLTNSGALFGSSAISVSTTPTVTLNNNIFVNTSVFNGATAFTVAYRRSSTTLTTYGSTSDRNLFYAGTPGTNRLIHHDGTNSFQTLTAYKNMTVPGTLAPRDANSISENPPFLSSTCGNANFLKINTAVATGVESGGVNITGFTDDFENDIRQGNAGYVTCGSPSGTGTRPDIGADEFCGTPLPLCQGQPATSTITGAAAVCALNGTTLSLSVTYTDIGISYQWASSTTQGGPYTTTLGTSATQATGNLSVPTYYICTITCGNSGLFYTTVEKSVLINALPTVTVSPTSGSYCTPSGSAVTLTAGGASTYAWSPTAGLTPTNGSPVSAAPSSNTTYTVTGTDGNGCTNTATAVISVAVTPQLVTATATPSTICSGTSSNLTSSAYVQNTASLPNAYAFNGTVGTYVAISGTAAGAGALGDDVGVGNLPIGFTFNYNNIAQTVFAVSSNGFIQLGATSISGFSSNALATTANVIAGLWDDNNTSNGGAVEYSTTGIAGSRVLTVQWTGMHVGASGNSAQPTINLQIKLYETTGIIQIVYGSTSAALTSTTATIGISGASGNFISVTPLSPPNTSTFSTATENASVASATNIPSGTTYTFKAPSLALTYAWALAAHVVNPGSQNTATNNLSGTETFTVTASNGGCSATATASVTVDPLTCSPATASATRCAGSNFTVTANRTGGGAPFHYAWSDGSATVYPDAAAITANLPAGTYNFTCAVTDACSGSCNSNVSVTVNALPSVSITPNPANAKICGTGNVVLTVGGTATSFAWSPTTGLAPTTGSPVTATPSATTAYTVTGTDGNGCIATASQTVTVGPAISFSSVTATPPAVCTGGNSQLNAVAVATPTSNYTVAPLSPAAETPTGTPVVLATGGTGAAGRAGNSLDDGYWDGITLPFNFTFYGNTYSTIRIATNGNVQFGAVVSTSGNPGNSSWTPQTIPTAGGNLDNFIGGPWMDQDVSVTPFGTIRYFTNGVSPNQKFVISYEAAHVFNSSDANTSQIILNENGTIDVLLLGNGLVATTLKAIGIENSDGSLGVAATGRNAVSWTTSADEAWRFTPPSLNYTWTPSTFLTSTTISNPIAQNVTAASTVYTVTAADGTSGCSATGTTSVTINQLDDNNACTTDACNPVDGSVTHTAVNTNDNNVCTTDGCNSLTGVFHTPLTNTGGGASDGLVCTSDDCNNGVTVNNAVPTNDGNPCTTDGCAEPTGVFHTNLTNTGGGASDGLVCTSDDCSNGVTVNNAVATNDNNPCTTDGCAEPTGVFHTNLTNTGGGASDGLVCTSDDCNNGVTVNNAVPTDDGNPCTTDGCAEPTGVFHTNLTNTGGGSDDGFVCTSDDCSNGATVHNAVATNDNNPCTTDGCAEPAGVFHTNLTNTGGGASDGLVCTSDDCNNGVTVNNAVPTDDGNPCTTDGCTEPTGVFHTNLTNTGGGSDDGFVCTSDDCNNGATVHNALPFNDNNPCTTDGCTEPTGVFHTNLTNTGGGATDNLVCTSDDCSSGTTVHNAVPIDDGNVCTLDACDEPGGVTHMDLSTIGGGISDGLACTSDDCNNGVSENNPIDPDDSNPCTTDGCTEPTGVFHTPLTNTGGGTTDNLVCTSDDCNNGATVHNNVPTDDGNVCTADGCTEPTGVYHTNLTNIGGGASDGLACTSDDCELVAGTVTVISEGFNSGAGFSADYTPSGWAQQNLSNPLGTDNWFDGPLSITPQSGSGYIGAGFNNGSGVSTLSNWLFAPTVTLHNGDVFSFWTLAPFNDQFADRLQVRMSTNGSSTNVGATETSTGDFSSLLLDINPTYTTSGYPLTWTQYSVTISGLGSPVSGRIAFRYFVENGGPSGANSDLIGVDNVLYTTAGFNAVTAHNVINPNDNNPCTTDGCTEPTGVFHTNLTNTGGGTNDNLACTSDDCNNGVSSNNVIPTDDSNPCTTDGCVEPTGVFHTPITSTGGGASDGLACTTDDCSNGATVHNPAVTDDNNLCTTDGCVEPTGVFHTPVSVDDNNPCTTDACDPLTGIITHVSTGAAHNQNSGLGYCTIQAAIDAASPGDVITVDPGTYTENVIVTKPVTLLGPNANINPCSGSRVAEAIVMPPSAQISFGEIFHVAASNVTISGFTINGDNPAVTSGFTSTNGADIDAAEGVTIYENGINNLTVNNNIIKNLSYFGVTLYGDGSGTATSGHNISNNKIQDLGTYDPASGIDYWGGAVLLYNNEYAAVTNNCIDNVRLGVQTGNFYSANPGAPASQVISSNTMTNVRRTGVFHNLAYSSASGLTFSNNSITGTSNTNETRWDGISMFSMSVPSFASGNTITATAVTQTSKGYEVWNVKSTSPASISGGSVTNATMGIFLNNYDGYASDAGDGAHATISGITLNAPAAGTGIRVYDNPLSTHANVQATIGAGVTINNGTNGLVVENTSASVPALGNVAFVGQSANYIQLINNPNNIGATTATFNGLTGGAATDAQNFAIEDKIVHKIDNSALGFVLVKAANDFVTVNSYVIPATNIAKIQRGVDASSNGFTVNVGPGAFYDNVTVDKEVTIVGRAQGITNVYPAISNPNCGGGSLCGGAASNVFLVQADNVKIHELTVDGDNTLLTSGEVFGGADLDARNGIITNHLAGVYQNLEVYNVTVQNVYLRGMYASSGGSFNFHNNTISNVQASPSSIGMFNFGGSGFMTSNNVTDCNDAISSNWSTGTVYSGNTVSSSGSGIHTDNNGGSGGIADTIRNNTVQNSDLNGYGIWVFAPYRNVQVLHNAVNNVDVGMASAGQQAAVTPVFFENSINGQNKVNSTGMYATTNLFGFGSSNSTVLFNGNYVINNDEGFYLETDGGFTLTFTANDNSITGNTILSVDTAGTDPHVLNFQCNWWGVNTDLTTSTVVGEAVNYTPWRIGGGDASVAIGFQPTAPCTGYPVADDNNVCTTDTYDPLTGSTIHTPVATDDGNPCTTDGCTNPTGVFHTNLTNIGGGTTDNLVCTSDDCNNGATVHVAVATDDSNPCTTDGCVEPTGIFHTNLTNIGGGADDNLVCTSDNCNNGATVHVAVVTNDNNPCTTDGCVEPTGIFHTNLTNIGGGTTDNLVCTSDDCNNGATVHVAVPTDDSNPCTTDGCAEPSGVFHTNLTNTGGGASDGLVCTQDNCLNGATVHPAVVTNDNNPCTTDGCVEPTGIFHTNLTNIGGGTTDNLVCTSDDCNNGVTVHVAVPTDDSNPCTTDGCAEPSGVFHTNLTNTGGGTSDGLVCTQDNCLNGATVHPAVVTNDNNPCTTDGCVEPTGVFHTNLTSTGGGSSDGLVCTQDNCANGVTVHPAVATDDSNPCTTDGCAEPSGVFHTNLTNTGGGTSDGLVCTQDNCANGVTVHPAVSTTDNNPCTTDGCVEPTGIFHTNLTNTGGGANDGLVCTTDDCNNGVTTHSSVATDDNNVCTTDGCAEPGGVFHTNLTNTGGGASDGLVCTQDNCANGVTVHPAVSTTDNNPCTTDGCSEPSGVFHTNLTNTGGGASDGLVCTTDDCNNGVTTHSAVATNDNNVCTTDGCAEPGGVFHTNLTNTGGGTSDGLVCTQDNCANGVTVHPAVATTDNNPCTTDACAEPTGVFHTNLTNTGGGASDGLVCTSDDCANGVTVHNVVNPSDNNPCTTDGCNEPTGVFHTNLTNTGGGASDGLVCTTDNCNNGVTVHVGLATDDGNVCTTDGCAEPSGVFHTPLNNTGGGATDGLVCTQDNCVNGATTHPAVPTDDFNVCTTDGCTEPSGVFHTNLTNIGGGATDNLVCTSDDCNNGATVHIALPTNDNNVCTTDGCTEPTGVFHTNLNNIGGGATDGLACTSDDCVNGATVHNAAVTNDNNPCTTDGCTEPSGVFHTNLTNIGGGSDDGLVCTSDDCVNGVTVNNAVNVDDGNPCTLDGCREPTGVSHQNLTNTGGGASDGLVCTQDNCSAGVTVHPAVATNDNNPCTTDGCTEPSGVFHTNLTNIGGGTTDNLVCTSDDCNNGATVHIAVPTNDNNPCTTDGCSEPGGVFHTNLTNSGGGASDGLVCTFDNCAAGVTVHPSVSTNDGNVCTTDGCAEPTGVFHTPLTNTGGGASDGLVCTQDNCSSGVTVHPAVATNDNNPCTTDGCAEPSGVFHTNLTNTGGGTSDGLACTSDDCVNGVTVNNAVATNDNNPCTTDGCTEPSGVFHTNLTNIGGGTTDNLVCTSDDCNNGATVHVAVATNDNNPCTTDGCTEPSGVFHTNLTNIGGGTTDNLVCTSDDCNNGATVHIAVPTNDNNVCTTDGCAEPTGVFHTNLTNIGGGATDNLVCTSDDCNNGATVHVAVATNDNNPCTTDGCTEPSGVFHTNLTNIGGGTTDNLVCTSDDCNNGATVHIAVPTNDNNVCTTDGCAEPTGVFHTNLTNIGGGATDNLVCTSDDCNNGATVHVAVATNDNNPCTTDGCTEPSGVFHTNLTNIGGGTTDNLVCTSDDCNNGATVHIAVPTNDNNVCTTDGCAEPTGVFHTGLTNVGGGASDGLACTQDNCAAGVTVHPAVVSNDNNPCTTDGCVEPTGVFHTNLTNTGGGASDGLVCTQDNCASGVTVHPAVPTNDGNPCTTDGCAEPTGVFHTANPVVVTATPSAPIQCFGYTTCINVSATGGSGSYVPGNTGSQCGYAAGDYTFTVTDNGGCTGTSSNVHLSEPDKIEGTATPTAATCGSSNGSVTVAPTGGSGTYTTYSWNSSPVQTTQTATGLAPGTYTVTITDNNGCTGTASAIVVNVGTAPTQPTAIVGPTGACKGQNGVVFTVVNNPGSTYIWTLPSGATGSSSTNSISVNFDLTYGGGVICVQAQNACGTSASSCMPIPVITGRPGFPASPSGPAISVCGPTTVTYTIPAVVNATSYQWTVTGSGFTLASGQGSTSITVNVAAGFSSGQVRVYAVSCSGVSSENSLTVYGTLTSQPQQAIFPFVGVCGGSTYTYAVTPFNGATTITWTGPAGSLINGLPSPQTFPGNTFSVNITFPVGFVSGNVTIFGNNGCGTGPSRTVAVRSTPLQPAFITGSSFVACGTSGVVYSTAGSTGATSYAWSVPAGVTIVSIAPNQLSITVNYTNAFSGSGSICVTPSNACGVGITRCLTVACAAAPVQGHTDAARTTDLGVSTQVTAYPNPTSGKLNVSFTAAVKEKYTLKVTDLIGKVMISQPNVAEEGVNLQELDLSGYAKGLYLLSIEREGVETQTMRIVVQ